MNYKSKIVRFISSLFYTVFRIDLSAPDILRIGLNEDNLFEISYANSNTIKRAVAKDEDELIKRVQNKSALRSVQELIVEISQYGNWNLIKPLFNALSGIKNLQVIISVEELLLQQSVENFPWEALTNINVTYRIVSESSDFDVEEAYTIQEKLKDRGVSLIFQYLYTKNDIWNIEEDYFKLTKAGVVCRFIPKSLSTSGSEVTVDNSLLDYEERYNLAIFYQKILEREELALAEKQYFQSLHNLFSGKNTTKEIAISQYTGNGFVLKQTLRDYVEGFSEMFWSKRLRPEKGVSTVRYLYLFYLLRKLFDTNRKPRIFIFGWYGTETVGDKAILGGIVNSYLEKYNRNVEIIIGSLYPYISQRTVYELGIDAKVVDTKNSDLLYYSSISDEVVMGGGPLMDLHHLYVPLIGFLMAKKFNNKKVVFGCGLGPLKTEKYKNVVKEILHLSDEIMLRDSASVSLAQSWGFSDVTLSGDPAGGYIMSIGNRITQDVESKNVLACYLRELPNSFFKDKSKKEFDEFRFKFESGLANFIKRKAKENRVDKIIFYHMHNFVVGDDDRDFSRYFIEKYFHNEPNVEYDRRLSTVVTVCNAMLNSKINVCMRFHSVLFAEKLGVDYVAVDYTNGGKIKALLTDINKTDRLYSIDKINREF